MLRINDVMDRIDRVFATRIYFRSIKNITWSERFWTSLKEDKFLSVASTVSLFAAALVFSEMAAHFLTGLGPLFEWLKWLFVSPAHAETAVSLFSDAKSITRVGLFIIISIAVLWALITLGVAKRADTRKLAADTIKTILGVYLGMLTRLGD